MTTTTSNSETKEIVTPYAFTVSPHLLGKPLASPTRRACAILIDVFLISVLSTISALIFAGFVALTFFRANSRLKKNTEKGAWHYTRVFLRGGGAFLIFLIAFIIVEGFDDQPESEFFSEQDGAEIAETLMFYSCQKDLQCVNEKGLKLAQSVAELDITSASFSQQIEERLQDMPWTEQEKVDTQAKLEEEYMLARTAYLDNLAAQTPSPSNIDSINESAAGDVDKLPESESQANPSYSIIGWIEGIMADLGLGLGWAALYFSVFTAWAKGQTIGKRLCKIKVVKLDGTVPNLWESFGRYGGYGAGFATGLLGFLQLYWDANRQAIQDKISETLVLRVDKHGGQVEENTVEDADSSDETTSNNTSL